MGKISGIKDFFSNIFKRKPKNQEGFKNNRNKKKFKLKYLPKVLNRTEKILVLILFITAVASLGKISFDFYCQHVDIKPDFGGKYIEGIVGEPTYINPLFASANDVDMDLSSMIFSGLMKYNNKQELVPDLAEKYEVSKDGKKYTFTLRQGIKWHDGKDLNADDVLFTVQTIKNPDFQSPLLSNFENVTVTKVDDYTIRFTLKGDSLSPFLKENTTFGIIPKHIWQEIPAKNALLSEFNIAPVGSGSYKFSEFKKDKRSGIILSYTLERNKNFYLGSPYIDKITFKFYDTYAQLVDGLNKQEVDSISYLPPEQEENIKAEVMENVFRYDLILPRYYALFFNEPKNEALANLEVRKALAHATDKQRIINEVFASRGVQINSPILESFLGYNSEIQIYDFNKDQSNEILHNASWNTINEDGYRTKDDKALKVTITTTDQPEFVQLANLIKDMWKEAGVNVEIQAIDATELQTEYIRPRNYEILLFGQLLGHDPDPYPFWHSSQRTDPGLNLTSFKNETLDELLETARKTSKEEDRRLKYLHFQNIIAENLPAIFLASPTYTYGLSKDVRGVALDFITTPSDRFTDAKDWFVEIDRRWK